MRFNGGRGRSLKDTLVGDRAFYRKVLAVAVPMMIQNAITNFVSLLDNIMVGRVGTEQMSGVAIVNQLLFVYYLCIFGGLAGAGIFTAQYYGTKDHEGIRHTFHYKMWLALGVTALAVGLFLWKGDALISLYLNPSDSAGDLEATRRWALEYMRVMLLGLPAFMMVQIYTSTLRECSETRLPMRASITAVLMNLVFNYILIFGHFGFPRMGVVGAAVATVISRYVEMLIVVIWTHMHPDKNPYIAGIYRRWGIPRDLVKTITVKGFPLLLNEALWSSSQAILVQCYAVRGLTVVAALNISSTITNLFNCVFLSMGSSVAIIVGQLLGAGRMEEARDTDNKMIALSIALSSLVALAVFATAPFFPRMYNTEEDVRHLATIFMLITGIFMPQNAFMNATYFTLRSGGKTLLTFLFDSVNGWVISIPIAFILSRFTGLHVAYIMILVMIGDWGKCILGFVLVKKGIWLQNIVGKS
ncbi:MAG: MATE family efflux transporter [Clostridia bacterium]|nr:MATE family efflux transporter [Clostridia bacterium]